MHIPFHSVRVDATALAQITPIHEFSLWTRLTRLCQTFLRNLTTTAEPRIYQVPTLDGPFIWRVEDPSTGQIVYLASEHEVRVWIEERYRFAD